MLITEDRPDDLSNDIPRTSLTGSQRHIRISRGAYDRQSEENNPVLECARRNLAFITS